MLFTFGLLMLAIPVAFGWGSVLVLVRKFLRVPSPETFDPLEPIFGLALLTAAAILINFFWAVSVRWAVIVFALGWIAFLWRMRSFRAVADHPFLVVGAFLWLGAISTHAVLQAWNFDSGLYHLPAIRWLADYALPLGLGNLHGRLGFDSAWFPLSALLAGIASSRTANYAALASELFLALYGLAVLWGISKFFRGDRSLSTLLLIILAAVGLSPTLEQNLSSPSTDHPVLLLTLLLIYLAVRTLEATEPANARYHLLLLVWLSLFTVTVKVSMLPVLLLPVLLFFLLQRNQPLLLDRRTLALVALIVVLVPGVWVVRNFLLSGCLIYPVNLTCLYNVSWSVTAAQVQHEALQIGRWARQPFASPADLANWHWLGPWFDRVRTALDLWLAAAVLGFGLLFLLFTRKQPDGYNVRAMLLLLGLVILSGVFWFFSAPDLRFGVSWFWAIGLLVLALGIYKLLPLSFAPRVVQTAAIVLFLASAYGIAQVGVGYVQRAGGGIDGLLYAVPPSIKGQLETKKTTQGRSLLIATKDARCYWEAMCTPYFDAGLKIDVMPNGRLAFSHPVAQP